MTAELNPRTQVYRWPSGTDPFTRDQMNESHDALEDRVATFLSGPIAERPTASDGAVTPSTERMFYLALDQNEPYGVLYYCDYVENNNSTMAWVTVNQFGSPGNIVPGDIAADGTEQTVARADHTHGMLPWGDVNDVASVQTVKGAGSADAYARADHVHILGTGSVTAGTIATGGVSASTQLANNVVTSGAIANGAVTRVKIAESERIPVGSLMPFAGFSAPNGWLLCDGTAVSRTAYADLFAVIGVRFNTGNADSSTFKLPDLTNAIPIGYASSTSEIGNTVGSNSLLLSGTNVPSHVHSITHNHAAFEISGGNHRHDQPAIATGVSGANTGLPTGILAYTTEQAFSTYFTASHDHTVDIPNHVQDSGSNLTGGQSQTAVDMRQESLVMSYIIKA